MNRKLIERPRQRHEIADVTLIVTTVTLAVSLVIAVTVVSIGIARADTLVPAADGSGRFALAILVGLVIAGMGGLTAAMAHGGNHRRQRH